MGDVKRIDYDGIIAETEKAILFDIQGENIWIPRSAIVDPEDGDGMERGDPAGEVALLTWIVREKGLE